MTALLVPTRTSDDLPEPIDLPDTENQDCHEFRSIVCLHCGKEINIPIYCGDRFCPTCSVPRLARVRNKLKYLVYRTFKVKGYSLKFLTLTIPNEKDLPSMLKSLVKSFRKLRNRSFWKQRVLGGAFVLEVTGTPGDWHGHLHMLLHSKYLKQSTLVRLWQEVSTGRGVYIKQIPPSKAVAYLSKYLTKPKRPEQVCTDISQSLRSFRLFQSFGDWYGWMKDFNPEPHGCPTCGSNCWCPTDILYRNPSECKFLSPYD